MSFSLGSGTFKALDASPGGTLKLFDKYIQNIKLVFELAFWKDGTPFEPLDKEKKAILLFCGRDDMKDLFEHVGAVTDADTFTGLQGRTNNVRQRNLPLRTICRELNHLNAEQKKSEMPPNYENYDWKQAAVDAILLQTSNPKLRERPL